MISVTREHLGVVREWAQSYIATHSEPDFTVLQGELPYLQRWYVIPRNDIRNVYLHRFLLSDEDRALHDHRGDNTSWLLDGAYVEHCGFYRNDGSIYIPRPKRRVTGEVVDRKAENLHRVELIDGKPVLGCGD